MVYVLQLVGVFCKNVKKKKKDPVVKWMFEDKMGIDDYELLIRNTGNASLNYQDMSCAKTKAIKVSTVAKAERKK